MIGASFYIIVCSARNRARVRLQRLRQPRYLIGAIVGVAYLYFSIFRRMGTGRSGVTRRRRDRSPLSVPELAAAGPAVAGIALLAVSALSWIMPFNSGLLEFSDAEVQFLFPAPVTRRQLLLHRMVRSQLGLLFGALVFGVTVPSASGFDRLRTGVATWFLLATWKFYYTGVSLARARLRTGGTAARRAAWLPLAMVLTAVAIVATALTRAGLAAPPSGVRGVLALIGEVASQPLPHLVLWPFIALARPLFLYTQPLSVYLVALFWSSVVLLATVAWVLMSDSAFQDAAADAVERRSRRISAQRTVSYNTRSAGWTLALAGRAEAAFAWKAAMQTLRVVDRRSLVRLGAIFAVATLAAMTYGREGPAAVLGAFAMTAAVFAILVAPQIIRVDIRQDLQHIELMKTWPVKGSTVVRGELLWPGAFITAIAWVMIAAATMLSGTVLTKITLGWRLGGGVALAILAPALVFAQLTVHNAVALMFPAWVPLGSQRARGLDAMGQRLIMLGGTWLLLIVMALPGALAGFIVWFAAQLFVGPAALVPAALVCTAVIAVEVLLASEALGPAYDRLDVLAVERAE